jgi:tripartite-type tricarboxylate transporter receptor subunit TctC
VALTGQENPMKVLRVLIALVLLAGAVGEAVAQAYPSRTITVVVPFSAGGAVDVMARVLSEKISESVGQRVIVENRGGGGGTIGMNSVAKAEPDGHTILYTPNSVAINSALYRNLPFNAQKDLAPISQAISSTLVLTAHPKLKVATVRELIAMAKARPGKLNFGSAGVADPLQLGVEMLKISTGIDMLAIPYKGQGPMFAALLAGEVDLAIVSLLTSLAPIQNGQLRALGVTGPKRSAALPDVPTVAEAGVPGYDLTSWHGFFAPGGTPREIIARLHKEVMRAVNLPDVRKRIEATGNDVVGSTPEEFGTKFRTDEALFKKIVLDAGIPFQD